jgi:heptosyltransferase-3
MPGKIEHVGILCSAALGDTLLLSGPIADLRAHFSQQRLILFCTAQNIAAAELIPGLDKRVVYSLTQPVEAVRLLRSERLDLLVDFSGWQRLTGLYAFFSGAQFTAGFRTREQHRHYGYDRVSDHTGDRHEIENFRYLLRSLDIPAFNDPKISPPRVGLPQDLTGRNLVVLHLWPSGTRSWLREWPQEGWLELSRKLQTLIPDPHFVLTGSPKDRDRSYEFQLKLQACGHSVSLFTGTDGFATLCKVLSTARLVVSTNTGVMHLAAILGAPTVSINGPNSNRRWGPIGPRAIGVEAPGKGCGFLDLGFEFDGNPTDCMQRTSVDQVLEAARKVMQYL